MNGPLFQEQLQRELEEISSRQYAMSERDRNDLAGFAENMPGLVTIMKEDPNFAVFDFLSKEEVYRIDIGPIQKQMEYEIFDDLKVSAEIPFIVMNNNRKKVQGKKGRYVADQRYFKIYHGAESPDLPLEQWINNEKYAPPYTIVMKVYNSETRKSDPSKDLSYLNMVYVYGDGLYLKLNPEQALNLNLDRILDILVRHFDLFKPAAPTVHSLTGSFVVDRLTIDNFIFRSLLLEPHDMGRSRPLVYQPFLWVNEQSRGYSLRSQFILNFRLGDIVAKIVISEKVAKTNNVFYSNGSQLKFNPGAVYNQVSISDVKNLEYASLIKDIVASVFYLYGRPEVKDQIIYSRSMIWSSVFTTLLQQNLFLGAAFGPSLRISTAEIRALGKNIMQLRSCDPTFYGKIASAKPNSKGDRQPICLVSTADPNWREILFAAVKDIEENDEKKRQIIRYPFSISNPPSEEYSRIPITTVPPYFLIARPGAPYLKPKIIKDPRGMDGTYHPFLLSCAVNEKIIVPLAPLPDTVAAKFNILANLDVPFQITMINKDPSGKSSYKHSTIKVLREDARGGIPTALVKVLSFVLLNGQQNANLELDFERVGFPKAADSLLQILAATSKAHFALNEHYQAAKSQNLEAFIAELRLQIANSVDWNVTKQELYDLEPDQARQLFLDPKTSVDSKLFRVVLEKFFKVFLCVIEYKDMKAAIEIPRHRYFHIGRNYPPETQTVVVFKHQKEGGSVPGINMRYELLNFSVRRGEEMFYNVDWPLASMKYLFDSANETVDTSFLTVKRLNENVFETGSVIRTGIGNKPGLETVFNLQKVPLQYVDGAGKLRAFLHGYQSPNFTQKYVTISCEPLRPLEKGCFDDPKFIQNMIQQGADHRQFFRPQNFDLVLEFLASLGVKAEQLAFRLEPEQLQLVEEVIETPDQPAETTEEETEGEDADRPEIPDKVKQMSIMEQIMSGSAPAAPAVVVKKEVVAKPKSTRRRVQRSKDGNALAIGIWFKLQGLQFYIATTPGTPPTPVFAVDNLAFFDVDPEMIIFRQHDYYEKIANILIQLVRNLYIYSLMDDPLLFVEKVVLVDPQNVYDISRARRRIPNTRVFREALVGYAELYPSFFRANDQDFLPYRLVVDSDRSKKAVLQQLKIVQKLKEDIVGSSGSRFRVVVNKGVRRVFYRLAKQYLDNEAQDVEFEGLNEFAIERIPRLKQFMVRPDYLLEFYVYSADFRVRGLDQHVFLSEEEIRQYLDLLEMEAPAKMVKLPLSQENRTVKYVQYYTGRDGSVYIIQNVVGGEAHRARNVVFGWETDRVNNGYFTDPYNGTLSDVPLLKAVDLHLLDPALGAALLDYGGSSYAALLKLSGALTY